MPMASAEKQRAYQRDWHRRDRDRRRPTHASVCHLDGYPLIDGTDMLGRVVTRCRACERRRAGRCMDCGAPVKGRSWRCAAHKAASKVKAWRLSGQRHRAERNRARRARYWKDEESRKREADRKREWRQANPMKVALAKRRARLAGKYGYRSRRKWEAYQARYREQHRERRREIARAKYYELHPVRPEPVCRKCGRRLSWWSGVTPGRPPKVCNAHARDGQDRPARRPINQEKVG